MIKERIIKTSLLILLIGVCNNSHAQTIADTAAIIKEFNRVMSFAVQPYLYYKTEIKADAIPVLQSSDTTTMYGIFYKNNSNLYYGNGQEEVYLEDSFYYQVNHNRKSIWIGKVDSSVKDNMNTYPLSNILLQESLQKRYIISKSMVNTNTVRIDFTKRPDSLTMPGNSTRIGLEYNPNTFLPQKMEIIVQVREPLDDNSIELLKAEHINLAELVKETGNVKYMERTQRMSISFITIDNHREKVVNIPTMAGKLNYNDQLEEYTGKGIYIDFEIVKMY